MRQKFHRRWGTKRQSVQDWGAIDDLSAASFCVGVPLIPTRSRRGRSARELRSLRHPTQDRIVPKLPRSSWAAVNSEIQTVNWLKNETNAVRQGGQTGGSGEDVVASLMAFGVHVSAMVAVSGLAATAWARMGWFGAPAPPSVGAPTGLAVLPGRQLRW